MNLPERSPGYLGWIFQVGEVKSGKGVVKNAQVNKKGLSNFA